jgi:hypothetical protein
MLLSSYKILEVTQILYSSIHFFLNMQDLKHKILLLLTEITIIGEVSSIILWTTNRPMG